MSGITYAQAELVAALEQQAAAARREMRELVEKADGLVMRDVDVAWARIEKAADGIIEKSGEPLTREQAISRVLKTAKGAELYDAYTHAQDTVRYALEQADGNAAGRGMDEWRREKTTATLQKTADAFGAGAVEEHAHELLRDPEVARAFGGRPVEPVEKGDAAWEAIDKAALSIMLEQPELSHEQAVAKALQRQPELYNQYVSALESEAALAPPLNTGPGVAGPPPFGSASSSGGLSGSADGSPVDPVAKADEDDAALARREAELWDEIVEKSGAAPFDPGFASRVDGFLDTPTGRKLYGKYVQTYAAREAVARR